MFKSVIFLVFLSNYCNAQYFINNNRFSYMKTEFSWKQIGYDINGIKYTKNETQEKSPDAVMFEEELNEDEMFFIPYNNLPFGVEVYKNRAFITVPRRKHGIPSTLNYVDLQSSGSSSPLLKPYPKDKYKSLVSVYRTRVDACERLWMVDTGLLEASRIQKTPPQIVVFDLKTDEEVLRYEIPGDVIVNGTTRGLTSIVVDVTSSTCDDAFAYINDLITNGLVVFSLKQRSSWRFSHSTFVYDVGATGFKIAGFTINWLDGLFSLALSDPDSQGIRTVYYHPLVSTLEFSITSDILKNKSANFEKSYKLEGVRGVFTQSGSHDFHSRTKTLFFANVAQDGIMCWNTQVPLTSKKTAVVAQSHTKLVYMSDLKIIGDEVWVVVNKIPIYINEMLDINDPNFFVHRGYVADLVRGSVCEIK